MKVSRLTTNELEVMFEVTKMTVNNWRIGSPRITPLPYHTLKRGSRFKIYFKATEVTKWAAKHNILVVVSLGKILEKRL